MSPERILVVDDDNMIRTLLKDSLGLEGYEVETADGADSCIKALSEGIFDALVLDLMMPKVTGLELFQQVRKINEDLPVIILTAYASKESAIEALRLGAHDYLEKPVEREHLIHSIQRGIERRKLKKENSYLVDQLRQRVERLKLINQMGAALTSSLETERVLSMAMQMSKRTVGAESCAIFIRDPKTGKLGFVVGLDPQGKEIKPESGGEAFLMEGDFAIAEWVIKDPKPIIIPDAMTDPRFVVAENVNGGEPTSWLGYKSRAIIAAPLIQRDKVLGSILVINKTDGSEFTNNDALFIRLTANFVTVAIENARLASDLKHSRFEIEENNKQLEVKVKERTADVTYANTMLENSNRELRETRNKLVQSEKMASIGQLAAGVAHEINNPLGFIQSNLSTLSDYIRSVLKLIGRYEGFEEVAASLDQPKLNAYLKMVAAMKKEVEIDYLKQDFFNLLQETQEGTTRVARIVQGLKRFSQVDQDTVESLDINRTIEETLALARNEIKYKADVVLELGHIPPVSGNGLLLGQVFMNILLNAAQSIEGWGRIVIKTEAKDGKVVASFTDSGCGIPEQYLAKIFDPFFTTKEIGVGTGLGLSISYGIVEKHNGEIDVKSKVGGGTTFTIKLPALEESKEVGVAIDREVDLASEISNE